ncbi:helix-turn-helix transcriptional regulator [Rhodovulum sulfidophilum]|uniref:winged helix-turn-helix domain-containing protein n=1 Tax=Rhodovulum sulfidophilum TaxID=35806 RepID=UPI0019246430|nr:helix-turn-helix domain-containing protein [Rhodovulum sulfidophilum]MBL3595718.1 helix-turn-helix transcriptional regulator [Rhodovulum sulfidophilum]
MSIPTKTLDNFHKAATSLKLFSRAELSDEKNRSLIEKLYVDPLPNEQVFKTLLADNTTFLIGRKGTGKSTVFQRVQHELRKNKLNAISAYMDIRNVYETSQVDPAHLEKADKLEEALTASEIQKFLLLKRFFKSLLEDVRNELKTQVEQSFLSRLKDNLIGSSSEVFESLDAVINRLDAPNYEDIVGYVIAKKKDSSEISGAASVEMKSELSVGATGGQAKGSAAMSANAAASEASQEEYSQILMRIIQIPDVIDELRKILSSIGMRKLYIFLDDFSELPPDAMSTVVDGLISPLSRWSDFIKFKIAAYPGRIYIGDLDKTKIEEISLDIYDLYGGAGVTQMEEKATDFVRRITEKRFKHYKIDTEIVLGRSRGDDIFRTLFFSCMANPRMLGHILLYSYESSLIYNKKIGVRAVQDASERFFDEKVMPFFSTGAFRLAFRERSSIFSLKELLEAIVVKARTLRQEGSRSHDTSPDRLYSSHFYIAREYDDLLLSLELAFFLTKYFEQSDREGKRVSVYALNYGLCNKYQISFGRPAEKRSDRLFFVSRRFDYNGIIRDYINSNQEVKCSTCGKEYDVDILPALKMMNMKCPTCGGGPCEVINLSRKYEDLIKSVNADLLLPETEIGMLQALHTEERAMVAAEIASELDCSGQLIGRRGRKLSERDLVSREKSGPVYKYKLTEQAKSAYFEDVRGSSLNIDDAE